jgi:hypothetical protein
VTYPSFQPSLLAWGLIGALVILPAACTKPSATAPMTLTPAAQASLAKLCAQDAALQPAALGATVGVGAAVAPVAPTVGTVIASGAALDASTLHPLVVDACAKVVPAPAS